MLHVRSVYFKGCNTAVQPLVRELLNQEIPRRFVNKARQKSLVFSLSQIYLDCQHMEQSSHGLTLHLTLHALRLATEG